jgi:hypothetical protein
LVNRTVVLIGDSIERCETSPFFPSSSSSSSTKTKLKKKKSDSGDIYRFHARDFCDLLSSTTDPPFHGISENGFSPSQSNSTTPSRSFYVNKKETPELKRRPSYLFNPDDPEAVPPNWPVDQRQRYLDHHREWADRFVLFFFSSYCFVRPYTRHSSSFFFWDGRSDSDNIRTSPWICEVPSYGFTIVTLFTFGLEPYHAGSYYSDQDWCPSLLPPSKKKKCA